MADVVVSSRSAPTVRKRQRGGEAECHCGKKDLAKKKKTVRSIARLTTLDDFLGKEGNREEFEAIAVKEVLAWQIEQAMKANNISRNNLAQRMKTSRSQIGRLLDPKDGNVTLATLQRAARMVGRSLRLELV